MVNEISPWFRSPDLQYPGAGRTAVQSTRQQKLGLHLGAGNLLLNTKMGSLGATIPRPPSAPSLGGLRGYMTPGVLGAFGLEPERVLANGATRFTGWGMHADLPGSGLLNMNYSQTAAAAATQGSRWTREGISALAPGAPWGLALNAFSVYQGYKENGISGAYDSLMLNVGIEAAMYKWGYGVGIAGKVGQGVLPPGMKVSGSALKLSTGRGLAIGMGAGVGGYIGQQLGLATGLPMAGTLGAMAGSYIGGNPLGAISKNPVLVGGILAGVTAGAVSYGAYSVVKTVGKMGYAHRQSMRGINTDGDMSAFMTQNAMTMRERSVQAIAKSHLNARSALGQEASFMQSPRNYNSRYR